MAKVIDYILSINKFEQQCVVLKGILQSPWLKDHLQTIGIDQYKILQQLMDKLVLLAN